MSDHLSEPSAMPRRRLLLLRHAKSDWPDGVPDHERPLAERGRNAAPRMADYMAREALVPDLVLVSDSRRTRETWMLVKDRFPDGTPVELRADLYHAPAESILRDLTAIKEEVETILIIGHNPGMHEFAMKLVGEGRRQDREAMEEKFPTAALAVIDFNAPDWAGIRPGTGLLQRFVTPRSLA